MEKLQEGRREEGGGRRRRRMAMGRIAPTSCRNALAAGIWELCTPILYVNALIIILLL